MAKTTADATVRTTSDGPFDNIINFRDVGKTINKLLGEKRVAEGKVFRSARPDDATLSDRRRLQEDFGINTILDLRTVTEHANQAKKRQNDIKVPALLTSNDALAEPVKIPGIRYLEININGKGFERSLMWQLRTWSIIKLVFLMIIGYRNQAISILAGEVMNPRGLIGLGTDSLDVCGPEVAEAIRAFATTSDLPILVHCTQGKDRTGLVVVLLLAILFSEPLSSLDGEDGGAETAEAEKILEAISEDYLLSVPGLESERESRLKEIHTIGLTDEFADCPPDFVRRIVRYLKDKCGGIEKYLDSIGISLKEQQVIRRLLSLNSEESAVTAMASA